MVKTGDDWNTPLSSRNSRPEPAGLRTVTTAEIIPWEQSTLCNGIEGTLLLVIVTEAEGGELHPAEVTAKV